MKKTYLLFIGALKARNKDKSVGGLYTACSTLAEELKIKGINVIKLNTTYAAKSVSAKIPFHKKVYTLITRALEFIFKILINKKAKNILIFVSAGNSYIDKIPSVFVSKITNKNIIVFPRSGFLLRDFEKKKLMPFIKYVLNSANTIVCQSQFWKDYFVSKGIPENKLVIVENWVIDKVIEDSKGINFKSSVEKNEKFKLVFVSRIEKMKGVDDLLELAKLLKEKNLNYHISIYGAGKYAEEFEKQVAENELQDFITLEGWLSSESKIQTLNNYHLAIFTSRFEGYPNTLLDFIFSKVPVLATNIDCNKAVGKKYMQYYEPGNIKELLAKTSEIKSNYPLQVENASTLYKEKLKNNLIPAATDKITSYFK